MALNGRVDPNCMYASNPYHECGVACLEKFARGHHRKEEKKSGFIFHTGFGRKKKAPESLSQSLGAVNNFSDIKAIKHADPEFSPSSHSSKPNTRPENTLAFLLSQQRSGRRNSQDHSFEQQQVQSSESIPMSGTATPDHYHPKSPSRIQASPREALCPFSGPESANASLCAFAKDVGKTSTGSIIEYMNFTFSGISNASNESDVEETRSVISESCVSVGRYHVRPSVADILQLIFDKYGDIAEGSRLASASMQAYYLEGLCSVVQELQFTTFKHLTKSKLKEMFAVLRDVESAQIDVSWLRAILDELAEAIMLNSQYQDSDVTKSNCDHLIERTREELESMMEDLAQKEKAVSDVKAQIAKTRAHLSKLEHQSSQLDDTVSSIWSKVEKFHSTPLANDIL